VPFKSISTWILQHNFPRGKSSYKLLCNELSIWRGSPSKLFVSIDFPFFFWILVKLTWWHICVKFPVELRVKFPIQLFKKISRDSTADSEPSRLLDDFTGVEVEKPSNIQQCKWSHLRKKYICTFGKIKYWWYVWSHEMNQFSKSFFCSVFCINNKEK